MESRPTVTHTPKPPCKPAKQVLPIVYSCSGCSSAAQTANYLALELDRLGAAEMSCIAGVGGNVPALVRLARSGRPIVALDGCPLACVAASLAQRELVPTVHIRLDHHGVRKHKRVAYDPHQAEVLLPELLRTVAALRVAALPRTVDAGGGSENTGGCVPSVPPQGPAG